MRPLILFDIDATLLTTTGVGVAAIEDAGREVFGPAFDATGIDYAGRLDPLIIGDMIARNRGHAGHHLPMRGAYERHLRRHLAECRTARALPGVLELVRRLRSRSDVVIGLLTGNFAETGSLKLAACGLDAAWFPVTAWGDESPHTPPARDHLPPVAMGRYAKTLNGPVQQRLVTIIGDTPHDVRCASVNGCRSLAVATGKFTLDVLARCGPDRVVADLGDVDDIERWLVSQDPQQTQLT